MSRRLIGAALGVVVLASGCSAPGAGGVAGDPKANLLPVSQLVARAHGAGTDKQWRAIVNSSKKMYGVAMPGVPQTLAPLLNLTKRVHKTPSVLEYFQDWGDSFDPENAKRTCVAGMIPELTWESWSWLDLSGGKPSPLQPTYAPRRIARGHFDHYIRQTAKAMKSIHCTMLLRFDQEANGYWYPWGIRTAGMHGTPEDYVAMWRHVWRIFRHVGATNVRWVWSPNLVLPHRTYPMARLYPGDRYVDAVGIDGYVGEPQQHPRSLYASTLEELSAFASARPWFVAETGVAPGPNQARRVRGLVRMVAESPQLHGLVYLDSPYGVHDWSLHGDALRAFRHAIADPIFGHGRTRESPVS